MYIVKLFRRINMVNGWCDDTYTKDFDTYTNSLNYFNGLIDINLYSSSYVIIQLWESDKCIGCWDSKEYKNANKTKTSNL